MAQSLLAGYGNEGIVDNQTTFLPIGTSIIQNTSVAQREQIVRDAGSFLNLFVYVPTNTASVTSTITLQKSTVDTALTVSYTSDQTGIKEDTDSVAFLATDEINYEVTIPSEGGTNTLTISVLKIEFIPDTITNCISFLGKLSGVFSSASTTSFMLPVGDGSYNTTENNVKLRIRETFVASNLYFYASANARTTDVVIKTRVDGGDGNQSFTYTSGQTGAKEDTSNTDSLSAGNDFNLSITTGTGTENFNLNGGAQMIRLVNTLNKNALYKGLSSGFSFAANSTRYTGIGGSGLGNASEILTQFYPQFNITASELGVFVSANAGASLASTINLRDNGGVSTLIVSYLAGQTGLKNDSSNTVEISSGTDEINYEIICLDLTGGITITWIGILATSTTTVTFISKPPLIINQTINRANTY